MAAYLERREELIRYFRVRMRSLEAAQDLVQEIYLKVARRSDEEIGNPGAYLYRLGTNLMLDQLKKERRVQRRAAAWREVAVDAEGGGPATVDEPSADQIVSARQRLRLVLAAVEQMSPQVREAFRLHKLTGLSHSETAAAMGVSRSSVEKYIMSALKRISAEVGR